ncbi:amidohydrolase [uncultured Pseudosulfitobacter sp.]|uniref:amidohydrolase n=1 Tax=uncultured Pseudosulfitobacter sp. TaxID=2854214 RepID=UPI0030D89157
MTEVRRDLHAHPELSLEEARTADVVARHLEESGLEVTRGIGGHGVVGTLRRGGNRPAVMFRADMDALAIEEASGVAHASRNAGVMHACGHDGHTAMLLGAARALADDASVTRDIHFVFQPAEERYCGARRMIDDGLLTRFPCGMAFGLHNAPGLPVGTFATRTGPMMAASGIFSVVFTGTGGHGGARPHLAADLTLALAEFTIGLQTVIRRGFSPLDPIVLTLGSVQGGNENASNVMPARVKATGTMRCFTQESCDLIDTALNDLAARIALVNGCDVKLDAEWEARPLVTDAEATEIARTAVGTLGRDLNEAPMTTGAEDFSDLTQALPSSFMLIGNGVEKGAGGDALHAPTYDFNDKAIPYGIAYWTALAWQVSQG